MAEPIAEREAAFQRGIEAYRAGLHYEAHEIWEELWEDEDDDAHRLFLQALIQVASAMHKVLHGVGPRGCLRLLDSALQKTSALPAAHGGVDLARLRDGIAACRAEIERRLEQGASGLDATFIPVLSRAGEDSLSWKRRAAEPAPDHGQFKRGLDAYRRGDHFDAHEHWEELWRDEPDADRKRLLQGLILVAASMHKLLRMKSASGAQSLLDRASSKLHGAPADAAGLAMDELFAGIARAKLAIAALAEEGRTDLDASLVPRIRRLDEKG